MDSDAGTVFLHAVNDAARIDWEFLIVREAISRDWASLASNDLSAEQRRAVREHLTVHVTALRELVERHRLALQSMKANRLQTATGLPTVSAIQKTFE